MPLPARALAVPLARIRSASYCIVRSRVSCTSEPGSAFLVTFSAPVIVCPLTPRSTITFPLVPLRALL